MRSLLTILFLAFSVAVFCQQPVKIEGATKKTGEKTYELILKIKLENGWYVYANLDEASGIEPISIEFENPNIEGISTTIDQSLQAISDPLFENKKFDVFKGDFILTKKIKIEGTIPGSLNFTVKGFAANGTEFLPIEEVKEVKLEGGVSEDLRISGVNINNPAAPCGDKQNNQKSLLAIFLIGFGGGLIALLTPCIFPMIPVTVSFFTNKASTRQRSIRNASLYGFFIFLIYLVASAPFHLLGNINPQIFNIISTNPWVNVFFFGVFILFALSFFGLFEIRLPSAVSNAAGSRSGIFFMALTLAIVSFSCTGIILGSLLVNALSSGGNAWQLTAGMGGFGAALALPFALFAMFPQWLSKIPKSGGWLDTVKKALAFIELALAIKFLSNADLVAHWGILKREVFIGSWLIIALGLTLYLFNIGWFFRYGKLNVTKGRFAFGIGALAFAIYLIPGLTQSRYANLKLLSGFAPPLSYSIYGKNNIEGKGLEPDVINDYDKAIALSKETNKPLLIDFTGWACVNCRKMEEQVWTQAPVKDLIKQNYVLLSLYVDDRGKTPDGKSIGEKWAKFQSVNFKQVTQPLYVVLSPDEKLMNYPVGYTPNAQMYRKWLQCGLDAYKSEAKAEGKNEDTVRVL